MINYLSKEVNIMTDPKIGVTLYNCRDFTKTPADIAMTLKKVRKIGYRYVQLSGLGPVAPEELKKMLDNEGLQVCITHTPYDRLKNDLDAVIREHHLWNCPHVAVGSMPGEYANPEGFVRFAGECSEIGKKLAAAGLTFSYHNHHWELERQNGKTGLEILFSQSDPKYLFAEIDTYWIQYGGGDPAAWIRRMKGRVPVVHFKDMAVVKGKPVMTEVGEGNLNWKEIIKACRESRVEYAVVEQDECLIDPFESIAISYRNLKKM